MCIHIYIYIHRYTHTYVSLIYIYIYIYIYNYIQLYTTVLSMTEKAPLGECQRHLLEVS